MHQEAKKGMLLTLGAVGLVVIGALIAVLTLKLTKTDSTPVPAAPAVAEAPVSQTPAAAPQPQATPAATAAPATPMVAQVTSVQPHYTVHSYPSRVCRDEPHTTVVTQPANGPSGMGAVVGGLAGGALGNQVGQGRGRTAATIGGVVLGALAGNRVEGNMNSPTQQEETVMVPVCHTRYLQKSVVSGYDVSYVYNGQPGSTRMKYAPAVGSTIPLTLQPS